MFRPCSTGQRHGQCVEFKWVQQTGNRAGRLLNSRVEGWRPPPTPLRREWCRCGCQALLETLVDGQRFAGTCYRAANWILLGQTQGRGRMDRYHQADGSARKLVFVYPLCSHVQQRLREAQPPWFSEAEADWA